MRAGIDYIEGETTDGKNFIVVLYLEYLLTLIFYFRYTRKLTFSQAIEPTTIY